MSSPPASEPRSNHALPYLHWLVVCAACGSTTLGRALSPCSQIASITTNEVVKCTHCNDVRQYLAGQFFLGPYPHKLSAPAALPRHRYGPTLVIAAAIIAAVRLARDDISVRSPKVLSTIGGSVQLAKDLLDAVRKRFPDSD